MRCARTFYFLLFATIKVLNKTRLSNKELSRKIRDGWCMCQYNITFFILFCTHLHYILEPADRLTGIHTHLSRTPMTNCATSQKERMMQHTDADTGTSPTNHMISTRDVQAKYVQHYLSLFCDGNFL